MFQHSDSQTRRAHILDEEKVAPEVSDPLVAVDQSCGAFLGDLSAGPYAFLASFLDETSLCRTDATCRLVSQANGDAWRALGAIVFRGLELDAKGFFELETRESEVGSKRVRVDLGSVDWKLRFKQFRIEALQFRGKFDETSGVITTIKEQDEVAYCKCYIRPDRLALQSGHGIYLEVEVTVNADTTSLSIVDFDEGGESSVTFSPEHGVVIRERKIQTSPCVTRGAYFQPLPPKLDKFTGMMGLYILGDQVAFFRRCEDSEDWETTGFVIDLQWAAKGQRLTPCLAFRDEGQYHVRVAKMSPDPPLVPKTLPGASDEANWKETIWRASN